MKCNKLYSRLFILVSATALLTSCVSTPTEVKIEKKPEIKTTNSSKAQSECTDPNKLLTGGENTAASAKDLSLPTAPVSAAQKTSQDTTITVEKTVPENPVSGSLQSKNNVTNQPLIADCVPKGIIQIAESSSIDPALRASFDSATQLLQKEQYSEAVQILETLTAKLNGFTAPWINLGIAYVKLKQLEKAVESFKQALNLNPNHPVANNELALVYRRMGNYTEARKVYEALLEQYPGFWPANRNLGVLCDIYLQDLNCALENYEIYAKAKPEDEKMKIWIADVKSRL